MRNNEIVSSCKHFASEVEAKKKKIASALIPDISCNDRGQAVRGLF